MKFWPIYILCFVLGQSCTSPDTKVAVGQLDNFTCDVEKVVELDGVKLFASSEKSLNLSAGETQSNDFSRSGKYSAKLDSIHNYALGFSLIDFKNGEYLRFSVWQKKGNDKAFMSVKLKGDDFESNISSSFYQCTTEEGDWVQHNISLVVSEGLKELEVSVTGGGRLTYFDDLEFQKLPAIPKNNLLDEVDIVLPEKSKNELQNFIAQAIKSPVIKSEYKEYVKGKLLYGDDLHKMKIKLKGDWTDHLSSGKPSCRIKMGGNNAYEGLKTFSLHHAKTRNYLDEWLVHQMADGEDVLSTTYKLVNVSVNQHNYGVYALEEHFDKQLLEQRNRREGPILKFDENGIWELAFLESEEVVLSQFPYFDASVVNMFKENRTLSTPSLKKNFTDAATLMTLFKNGKAKVSDIFDVQQVAKYYAIIDMCGGAHASTWHNRRFYYNPVTEKIEHILYDAMPFSYGVYYYNSIMMKLNSDVRSKDVSLDVALILDQDFKQAYLSELQKMSQVSYLDSMFMALDGEIDSLTRAIQVEEPYYNFVRQRFYDNALALRNSYSELTEKWDLFLAQNYSPNDLIESKEFQPRTDSLFVPGVSINAYVEKLDSVNYTLHVENYHLNKVTLCGYEQKGWKNHAIALENEIDLAGFGTAAATVDLKFTKAPTKLFFKVSNRLDQYYAVKVINWKVPGEESSRMKIRKNQLAIKPYQVVGNKAIFSGNVLIENLVYIPEHLAVEMKPGTKLEFKNGGGLIVSNSFIARGSAGNPIEVFCEDGLSQGLTILKGKEAIFEYVNFKGLSNLNYENWELTGAITIYETPVFISNVKIDSSLAEDGLNIIRSNFEIENLSLKMTTSDGFDADFCTGILSDSYFGNTGNDCIDFSGSVITIQNTIIENSGDKGVSGGERSTLILAHISITGAITGIASKDNTKIVGDDIAIKKTAYGLMAFEKKAEYGPATMKLTNTYISDTDTLQLIDKGSIISLNGVSKKGKVKVDVEQLYARFTK